MNLRDKNLLKGNLYWSASFESWNQRTDDLFYEISIFQKNRKNFKLKEKYTVNLIFTGDYVVEDQLLFERIEKHVKNKTL